MGGTLPLMRLGLVMINQEDEDSKLAVPNEQVQLSVERAHISQWSEKDFSSILWPGPEVIQKALLCRETGTQAADLCGGIQVRLAALVGTSSESQLRLGAAPQMPKWQEIDRQDHGDASQITLELDCSDQLLPEFPNRFVAHYDIHLGQSLTLTLTVHNEDKEPFLFEECFDIFFTVGDIKDVTSSNFDQVAFLDGNRGNRKSIHRGELAFVHATDLLFISDGDFVITDPRRRQRIVIETNNSANVTFWTPWLGANETLPRTVCDEWQHFLKIGLGNMGRDAVLIHPGESHIFSVNIEIQNLD